tara:strand:+ start:6529 stop:6972 length:444 start_codon:yes stop_codon:yes gene_type:complete
MNTKRPGTTFIAEVPKGWTVHPGDTPIISHPSHPPRKLVAGGWQEFDLMENENTALEKARDKNNEALAAMAEAREDAQRIEQKAQQAYFGHGNATKSQLKPLEYDKLRKHHRMMDKIRQQEQARTRFVKLLIWIGLTVTSAIAWLYS